MNIVREMIERSSIEEFAERYGLTMVVSERRPPHQSGAKFCARFKNVELKLGGMLAGRLGNGATEAEAIADYARTISGALLVENAYSDDARREIQAPILGET